ncbi:MAG: hydroxysqualene dehydroxylase HpnE [Planctomycetes bacterium]|nr:hydroxysqualene dehydroxylase HpnE [Planctomycetota bacterium]
MSDAPRAFVLGGGVAGMVAAFGLSERGFRVTLLESRRHCGGRAFATDDRVLGRRVDNGFHVMLGCYRAMRGLCRRLGTEGDFRQDRSLSMTYRLPEGRSTVLSLSRLPVPLSMPWSLLRLGIGFGARLRALFGMSTVLLGAPRERTFGEWLRRRWQTGQPDEVMWRPLCRAVMNCEPEEASAREFLATLREAFMGRASSAAFWVPNQTWGELLADPAPGALAAAGVELRTGARVAGLRREEGRVTALELAAGEPVEVGARDLVVSAMPWFALRAVLDDAAPFAALRSAPIVTVYFDVQHGTPPPDEGAVVALVGASPFHFVLRTPGDPVTRFAVLSGGDRSFDGMPIDDIIALARRQVGDYYPGVALDRATARVRKEQHATFVPSPDSARLRPEPGRLPGGPSNLLVCGDWTATGFPATLEGAARSSERMLAQLEAK